MNTTGDAAEQTFRIVIEGTEFVVRITGSLIKETLTMLYAISKDNKQNSIGKTNLANMLKNCKDIRIFTVQRKDLDKFVEEAKNYGIYYCTLMDKTNKSDDAIVDIMVRGDDAPRVNRIVQRFDLSITDTAKLRTESIKEKDKEVVDKTENEKQEENTLLIDDDKMADIMGETKVNEDEVKDGVSENFLLKAEVQLEHSLENKEDAIQKGDNKKSVREQLNEIKNEMKQKVSERTKEKQNDKKAKKKHKKQKNKQGGTKNEHTR